MNCVVTGEIYTAGKKIYGIDKSQLCPCVQHLTNSISGSDDKKIEIGFLSGKCNSVRLFSFQKYINVIATGWFSGLTKMGVVHPLGLVLVLTNSSKY